MWFYPQHFISMLNLFRPGEKYESSRLMPSTPLSTVYTNNLQIMIKSTVVRDVFHCEQTPSIWIFRTDTTKDAIAAISRCYSGGGGGEITSGGMCLFHKMVVTT